MVIQLSRQNRIKPALLAACSSCTGAFIAVRLRAFFITAWDISLPVWFLYAATVAAAVVSVCAYKHAAEFIKKYTPVGKPGFYIVTALSIVLCVIFRNVVLYTPLEGTGILPGWLASGVSLVGAGALLSVFVFLTVEAVGKALLHIRTLLAGLTIKDIIVCAAVLVITNFFAWLYIRNSHTIYFWDNAGYWSVSHHLAETARLGIVPLLKTVYDSVLTQDYNNLIVVPWIPLVRIFGPSRWVFIAGIINLSLFPVLVLLYLHIRTTCRRPILAFACVAVSFPFLFYTAITGFIDVSGLFVTLAAMLLWLRGTGKENLIQYFVIGCLLASAVLLRRWNAFFALSFFIMLLIDGIFFKKAAVPFITALLSFAFTLLFLFQPFVAEHLVKNYASLYSAYALGLGVDFQYLFYYFGILILLVAILGGVFLLSKRAARGQGVFLLLQPVVCFFLFVQVQSHGQQHLLLYAPALLCLVSVVYCRLSDNATVRKSFTAMMILASLLVFINPFFRRYRPATVAEIKTCAVLPSFNYIPPRRSDAGSIVDIIRYLDAVVGGANKTVGVLASSFTLNSDILLNAEASLGYDRVSDIDRNYLAWLPEVDSRDRFPGGLFDCDYLLVADPVQLHLGYNKQTSIALPAALVLEGTGFGAAFQPVGDTFYIRDGTVTVRLYEKTRDITERETAALLDAYDASKSG